MPLGSPNSQEAKPQMQKHSSNDKSAPGLEGVGEGGGAVSGSDSFRVISWKSQVPWPCSPATQEVAPHAPWAELMCPLYTLSPKICLQSQPQSPMSSHIIFTRFVTELFPPLPKVKSTLPEDKAKECGTGFRKDSERFPKCLGPGPHQRIK